MESSKIRRFFTNIICALVYNKHRRKTLRAVLNSPTIRHIKFIKKDLKQPLRRVKMFVGQQTRNLIIGVNDEYIYKFPLRRDNSRELALREKRVVDVFHAVSPIPIPGVELLDYDGHIVRKYEFIRGCTLRQLSTEDVLANIDTLARQIAVFIHEIARRDPAKLRDLKPADAGGPGFMYGWFQGDICDNFLVNPETMEITTFIDWEDNMYGDFSYVFSAEQRTPRRELMNAVHREYKRLYYGDKN